MSAPHETPGPERLVALLLEELMGGEIFRGITARSRRRMAFTLAGRLLARGVSVGAPDGLRAALEAIATTRPVNSPRTKTVTEDVAQAFYRAQEIARAALGSAPRGTGEHT